MHAATMKNAAEEMSEGISRMPFGRSTCRPRDRNAVPLFLDVKSEEAEHPLGVVAGL